MTRYFPSDGDKNLSPTSTISPSSNRRYEYDDELRVPPTYSNFGSPLRRSPNLSPSPTPTPAPAPSRFSLTSPTTSSLLSPPPPGFTRQPSTSPHATYAPFRPLALLSLGPDLGAGWPMLPPPMPVGMGRQEHPFVSHDVLEDEWARLLGDLGQLGRLSGVNKVVAGVAPGAIGVAFLPGMLISRGIEKHMRKKKLGPIEEIIEQWNCHYFRPRLLEVTLSKGDPHTQLENDSDSDTDSRDRRARKAARKQDRRDKQGQKSQKKQPWRLTVSYVPQQSQYGYGQQGFDMQGYGTPGYGTQGAGAAAYAPSSGSSSGMGMQWQSRSPY